MSRTAAAVFLLALVCVASAQTEPQTEADAYTTGVGPIYHTTAQLTSILQRLESTTPIRNVPLNAASGGRALQMFRIVDNGTSLAEQARMPTAFLVCNQHAREVITGETCTWLARLLGGDISTLYAWPEFLPALTKGIGATRLGASPSRQKVKAWMNSLISKVKVEVVPVMNPDGRGQVETNGRYAQRTVPGSGVDLNRNWPINRALPGSGADELIQGGEQWQGPAALSEWQTRAVWDHVKSSIPPASRAFWVDVHSGTWSLMTPVGGKFDLSSIPEATIDKWQALLNVMQPSFTSASNPNGISAGPSSGMLYASSGSAEDAGHAGLGFPYALTVEIFTPPNNAGSGVGWSCPPLKSWWRDCTEANMCGSTVCKDGRGSLQRPRPGLAEEAEAAAIMALAEEAAAAAAAGITPAAGGSLNAASDPIMRWYGQSGTSSYMQYFNPLTADDYRATVSKWLASLVFALDHVASQA